ncbi:MAG: hypothetical protein IT350_20650, partial [Deltaproteobacteria bacterium]|nr:hypothetical protein [Deltaproteobacteria bacterium]
RTSTHPLNSGFMLFNVPADGPYDFTATVDEEEETSTNAPQVFASSVTMTYLVYGGEYETNPTPTGCE